MSEPLSGPALSAAVARKVMGWVGGPANHPSYGWLAPKADGDGYVTVFAAGEAANAGQPALWRALWHPHDDIAQAVVAAEKLIADGLADEWSVHRDAIIHRPAHGSATAHGRYCL